MIRATFIATLLLTPAVNVGARNTAYAEAVCFMPLGDLPGGTFHSVAEDITPEGSVVVGRSTGVNGTEAFRWTAADGMVGIGDLPGGDLHSVAKAVSSDGSVIVGYSDSFYASDGFWEAFRWTADGGMEGLGDFPGGDFHSRATGVSGDGSFVVGRGDPDDIGPHVKAFGWTQEDGLFALGDLLGGDIDSIPYAVSDDGSTVVGWGESADGQEAFRWTADEGMVGLGDLPGGRFESVATAVTANGSVIFGGSDVGYYEYEGFRWTVETGMVSPGSDAILSDISADGTVGIGVKNNEAFIWDEVNGLRYIRDILTDHGIDMSDWNALAFANGISADGQTIVGTGFHDGVTEAWIAHIPEPSTLSLLALGAVLATRRRRTKIAAVNGEPTPGDQSPLDMQNLLESLQRLPDNKSFVASLTK